MFLKVRGLFLLIRSELWTFITLDSCLCLFLDHLYITLSNNVLHNNSSDSSFLTPSHSLYKTTRMCSLVLQCKFLTILTPFICTEKQQPTKNLGQFLLHSTSPETFFSCFHGYHGNRIEGQHCKTSESRNPHHGRHTNEYQHCKIAKAQIF